MDSALRPRDIQARIRAGETPESVAQVAGTTVERVMPFAAPVLAEREHVAQRAQRSSIRRRPSEGAATPTTARTLGDAVGNRLRTLGVEDGAVSWDAWRRDDGRWELAASFETGERAGSATFVFDTPGNYVQLEDDDARWLVGDTLPPPPDAPRDDLEEARARRGVVSLVDDELPLGEDAIGMVRGDAGPDDAGPDDVAEPSDPETEPGVGVLAEETTLDLTETARRVRGDTPAAPAAPEVSAPAAPAATTDPSDVLFESPVAASGGEDAAEEPATAPRPRRARKSRGRASVPSWDEIMFGTAQSD